jgi:hypothetical protein
MRVFQTRVLRRIFGPKRNGVTGEWKILYKGSGMFSTPTKYVLFG